MTVRLYSALLLGAFAFTAQAQMTVNSSQAPGWYVQNVLLGGGVTASNVTFNGGAGNIQNDQIGEFTLPGAGNLGLTDGVVMASGYVASDAQNFLFGANGNASDFAANSMGSGQSDPDLMTLAGQNIYDASILEFDFIPTGDSLKFRYVFGSEEYPGYTCSSFNDAFGFFLSGPGITGPFTNNAMNIALVPGTNIPIAINTVNSGVSSGGSNTLCDNADPNWQANSIYFVDNAGQSGTSVTYDGFTVVLTAFALVECGVQYHIKLAIGDGSDGTLDSGVFLEAGSFTSTGQVIPSLAGGVGIIGNTMMEGCAPVELVFVRLGDTTEVDTVDITVTGTATPGVDYFPALPNQLIFPAAEDSVFLTMNVPLDADALETITITIEQLIACAGIIVQTVFNFNIDSPPPLAVQSNDINGICGQTHVLTPVVAGGIGNYTYLWSTGETTASITVGPSVTTTYTCTVGDACTVTPVTVDFTVTLPIYPPLDITVDPPTAIDCLGTGPIAVTNATGGDGVYSYAWTVNGAPVNPGNTASIAVPASAPLYYVVTVSEGCGTSTQDSVLVTTVPLPPIVITTGGDTTVICLGDTTLIEVLNITGGNGVYTLEWTDANDVVISNSYSVTVPVPFDQTYTITVDDQCGYEGSEQVTTFIPHPAPFRLTLPPAQVLCAGDSLDMHSLVTGGSGYYHILWAGEDSITDPLYWVHPAEETTYSVWVKDQCGEELTDSVTIDVEHVITTIVVTNHGEDDWQFNAATWPYANNWIWDMGDGARYRHDECFHSFLDLENHWVTLKIVTPNGCHGIDSVLIQPPAHIYFPTCFTPDGDTHNETFGPVSDLIDDFEMSVFDRWGELVYTTTDLAKPWDGTVNGSGKASTGVYVYTYRAAGHYFEPQEGVGHVTLLRGSQDQ